MSRITTKKAWSYAAAALLAAGVTFSGVSAAGHQPARHAPTKRVEKPKPPQQAEAPQVKAEKKRLAKSLAHMKHRLRKQEHVLLRAETRAAKIDRLIVKRKASGLDTTALETAVATFRSSIDGARQSWSQSRDIVAGRVGFDAKGAVTNLDQARATLQSATAKLEESRTAARAAFQALSQALDAYELAHPEIEDPTPEI